MTPKRRLPNYIRSARLRTGLTQKELAHLLGCRGGKWVSRFELFERKPTFEVAMGFLFALGVTPEALFGGDCEEFREGIRRRAYVLNRALMNKPASPTVNLKIKTLRRILDSGSGGDPATNEKDSAE